LKLDGKIFTTHGPWPFLIGSVYKMNKDMIVLISTSIHITHLLKIVIFVIISNFSAPIFFYLKLSNVVKIGIAIQNTKNFLKHLGKSY